MSQTTDAGTELAAWRVRSASEFTRIKMNLKTPPLNQNTSRAFWDAEKKRHKAAGHVFDEAAMDQQFAQANGDAKSIACLHQNLANSPNPIAETTEKQRAALGNAFAAGCDTFGALISE